MIPPFQSVQAEKPSSSHQQNISPEHAGVHAPRQPASELQTQISGHQPLRWLIQAAGQVPNPREAQ